MDEAARRAGAPAGAINWMTTVTLEGTQELMKHRDVAVILATGGMGLVRAAYSAGKPAYGVGPGNAPAYIERTADVRKAVRDIITGKTFDNGVLCSSENSVVVDEADRRGGEARVPGAGRLLPVEGRDGRASRRVLVTPQRLPNPALVGKSATFIAEKCGITVPAGHARAHRAARGRRPRLSRSRSRSSAPSSPSTSCRDWREGCERCKQILRYGGMGHTMSIHSQNEQVILEFGLKKPAFRIVVNTPTTHGSIGLTTGLDPAMTLGCGGYGGNITSDNISPRHLLNIKRLAYEIAPVAEPVRACGRRRARCRRRPQRRRRRRASAPTSCTARIDAVPRRRAAIDQPAAAAPAAAASPRQAPDRPARPADAGDAPLDFVCEDDVRLAIQAGRKLARVGARHRDARPRATSASSTACSPSRPGAGVTRAAYC